MSWRHSAEAASWLLIASCLFSLLGTRGLNEPDEGRYAEIAREMTVSGDWLIPRLNGIEHFQKPPLLYWATVGGIGLLGTNEWGVRLPSALAALGTAWLTFSIARMLWGRAAAFAAAWVLVSSVEFFWMARLLTPDMLLTLWVTAALYCLVAYVEDPRRWAAHWGFFTAMGLGFLTKGPMALVVPISAALSWQRAARRQGQAFRLDWRRGLALTLGIGLSWFAVVSAQHPELVRYFVGYEFLQRVTAHVHGRERPIWFFAPVLLGGLFPWSLFVPALCASLGRRLRACTPLPPATWLLVGWIVPPLVILSLAGSKLATYVLPLFPAFAIGLGAWWRGHATTRPSALTLAAVMVTFGLLAAAAWVGPLVPGLLGPATLSLPFKVVTAMVCCLTAGGLWMAEAYRRRAASLFVVSGAACALWLASSIEAAHLNDALGRQASVRPIVQALLARPDLQHAHLFKCGVRADGFEFYSARMVSTPASDADMVLPPGPEARERLMASREACEPAFRDRSPAYGLVRRGRFTKSFARHGWRVVAEAGDFLLVTNPPPGRSRPRSPSE